MINIYRILMNKQSSNKDIKKYRKSNSSSQKSYEKNKSLCPYW